MFNFLKKGVSAEIYGQQLWQFCCNCAEKFCREYRPKLEAAGYLRSPSEKRAFMDEAMRLHLWIISRSLGASDRKILDVLHNHAHGLNSVGGKTFHDLYSIYDRAASEEMELQDQGHPHPLLAVTALQTLVGNKNFTDIVIAMEIHIDIQTLIGAVRQTRSEFRITS